MSGSVVVAHYGSPKAMGLGILGFGPRAMAAQRVIAHADRQPPGVAAPALYLLAVAATLTPGTSDAFSESLSDEEVAPFLALAEDAGARLILGFQPSRQSFLQTLQRFEQVLRLPNVGVGLQPAWHHVEGEPGAVDPPSWPTEGLEQALDWLSDVVPTSPKTIVLIHSTPEVGWPEEWTAASRPGLDVIGLADLTGTLDEKRTWLDQLAARAPAVGVQFRLRGDREIVEPVEALRLWPALRIVVYR